MTEIFDIVNENDKIIGKTTRKEAHKKGLLHRGVFFFILNKEKKIFVNQRSSTKEFYPDHWSIVCGGHVNSNEDYEDAAIRESLEETGLTEEPIFLSDYKKRFNKEDHENVKVYAFITDQQPKLDTNEVTQGKFMTMEELEQQLKKEKFLPETKVLYEILKINLKILFS